MEKIYRIETELFASRTNRAVVSVEQNIDQIFGGGDENVFIVGCWAKDHVEGEGVVFADGLVQVTLSVLFLTYIDI